MKRAFFVCSCLTVIFVIGVMPAITEETEDWVKIGLNYSKTGPYSVEGLDQWRAAQLAMEEINAAGGILGKQVKLVWRDSQSEADLSRRNVQEMIDQDGVEMVFGGSVNEVALAASQVCQKKGIPFFGTQTYSMDFTGEEGHWYTFRECYNTWMGVKALSAYLKRAYEGKKFAYISADDAWGRATEASFRRFTDTEDTSTHKGVFVPFPVTAKDDFKKALTWAETVNPDVLVLVLSGNEMVSAIREATTLELKNKTQIVVPNLTLGMAEEGGPKVMEGVLGALPWCWQVPYKYDYVRGKEFVQQYAAKFGRYPSTSGASAYSILHEYKNAVEQAGSFSADQVVQALENHTYQLLKDQQVWRDFDHQSVQTVYTVRCKSSVEVLKDEYNLDYFEILSSMPGDQVVRTRKEWDAVRSAAGKPTELEPLQEK
jgi:ABC-type branched-subunit amino acid transport system substrate-binding protein